MTTSDDFFTRVLGYAPAANREVVARIVRHLGIALQSRDGALVACTDPSERERVREKWLKKKLCLTEDDAVLDEAVMEVCGRMKADRAKCRVVFYYLLAEKYGKLHEL